jgi:hypothetical protein
MDRFGLRTARFCEQCGIHRDQLGDEVIAPFRECPKCGKAVCPNCWNLVDKGCLRCFQFSLPLTEPVAVDPLFLPATAPAIVEVADPPKPKRSRRGKAAAPIAAAGAAAVASPAAAAAAAPVAKTPVPAVATPAPKPPKSIAKSTAPPPPETRAVEWPDRSVEWQVRPGATAPDAPWPASASAAGPRVATRETPRPKPKAPKAPKPSRTGRLSSLVGFLVVAVALFGVAGLTLAALGRLPGPHPRAVVPPSTIEPTASPSLTSPDSSDVPVVIVPGTPSRTERPDTAGGNSDDRGSGSGGNGGPQETTAGPGTVIGSTPKPKPTPTPTAGATPTPTPEPTPTPTPDPTPTPEPTPTPTPDPTPTPEPTPEPS